MFSAAIQRTPFVTAAADRYFGGKIAGDRYGDDHTAVSTLRALLYHRIGNNTLYFEYMTTSYDLSRIGRRTESDWGDAFRTRFEGRDNYLTVMELCNPSKEANEKPSTSDGNQENVDQYFKTSSSVGEEIEEPSLVTDIDAALDAKSKAFLLIS